VDILVEHSNNRSWILGALIFLKLKRRDRSLQQKLSEIDYGGTILLIGSTTLLIIPITLG
jgi:hypothetical protein